MAKGARCFDKPQLEMHEELLPHPDSDPDSGKRQLNPGRPVLGAQAEAASPAADPGFAAELRPEPKLRSPRQLYLVPLKHLRYKGEGFCRNRCL